nr:hypothetical protein [Tanacetum cinerariifolium]
MNGIWVSSIFGDLSLILHLVIPTASFQCAGLGLFFGLTFLACEFCRVKNGMILQLCCVVVDSGRIEKQIHGSRGNRRACELGIRIHCQTWTSINSDMSSYRYASALPNLNKHKFKYEFLPVCQCIAKLGQT